MRPAASGGQRRPRPPHEEDDVSSDLWNYPADLWPQLMDAERRREDLSRLRAVRGTRRRVRWGLQARLRTALHLRPVGAAPAGR